MDLEPFLQGDFRLVLFSGLGPKEKFDPLMLKPDSMAIQAGCPRKAHRYITVEVLSYFSPRVV